MVNMTDDEKRLWESRKKAEELGVFDELKKIREAYRKERKRQIALREKSK